MENRVTEETHRKHIENGKAKFKHTNNFITFKWNEH